MAAHNALSRLQVALSSRLWTSVPDYNSQLPTKLLYSLLSPKQPIPGILFVAERRIGGKSG